LSPSTPLSPLFPKFPTPHFVHYHHTSGLCEGLESNFAVLAESNRDTLLKLMLTCLQDSFPELRQSAFALTGDLSKNCVQFISPIAPQLIDIILRNLDFDYPMVCNNASWTVGELAIKVGGGAMAPYIPRLMHSFIQILHEKDIPTTLTENVAITVGRLGVTNTAHLADHLSEYLEVWCM
jgi:transportin-1